VLRDTTNAGIPSVLVEMAFIDSSTDLNNLLLNKALFTNASRAVAGGVVTYFGLTPKPITANPVVDDEPTSYFKVQVGAYQYRQRAEEVAKALNSLGYDVTIVQ
jgi:hypothetical protein